MKAEDFIGLIEQNRFDKISKDIENSIDWIIEYQKTAYLKLYEDF